MLNYRALHQALNALPEGKRRLAHSKPWDNDLGCGCFWGTLLPCDEYPTPGLSFGVLTYARNKANTLQVVYGADTFYEVSRLEAANDRFDGTPEERFEYMRRVLAKKWVESLQAPWLVNDWENK